MKLRVAELEIQALKSQRPAPAPPPDMTHMRAGKSSHSELKRTAQLKLLEMSRVEIDDGKA